MLCRKINIHVPETALGWHLYDYALSYKAYRGMESVQGKKIRLTGLIVNSKTKNLNSNARTTEYKKF